MKVSKDFEAKTAVEPYPSSGASWYVVAMLLLAGIISFLDRQILSLLVGPVRHDLHITDTQMSLLQGLSFALLFSVVGLPLGHVVDRYNRRNIIVAGLTVWSIMTMLCGVVSGFGELFLCRMGVGIGEACLGPAAVSLISDYFPPERRGRALSAYVMSTHLGVGLSLVLGSVLLHLLHGRTSLSLPILGTIAGWKAVMIMAGIPGLFLVPFLFTVRETPRRGVVAGGGERGEKVAFKDFFAHIGGNWPGFVGLYFSLGLVAFMGYGAGTWSPTFLIRHYGLTPARAGVYIGVITAVAGVIACLTSGTLSDIFEKRKSGGGRLVVTIIGLSMTVISVVLYPMMPSFTLCIVFFVFFSFANAFSTASGPPAIQAVVPNQLRGKAIALYYLILAVFGAALGPTAVAFATDHLFKSDAAVGHSISLVPAIGGVIGILLALSGLRSYQRSRRSLLEA